MPRENSFTDSEGRSLTPDLEDGTGRNEALISPTHPQNDSEPHPKGTQSPSSASKHSVRSKATNRVAVSCVDGPTPKQKFRASVRKVMAMHRGTSLLLGRARIGAEPGVDPRRASADVFFSHFKQDCVIEVVDYSSVSCSFGRMTNAEFVEMMGDPVASERETWVKVRWINIAGISWDVIKAISIKYGLHPLALEDIFHTRNQNRSKADYYTKHLFLRLLCHELADGDGITEASRSQTFTDGPRSASPESIQNQKLDVSIEAPVDDDRMVFGSGLNSRQGTTKNRRRRPLLPRSIRDIEAMLTPGESGSSLEKFLRAEGAAAEARQKKKEAEVTLEALKQGERVNVNVNPMFIFLFRDGTVISIHPSPKNDMTAPITQRLRQTDTVLRKSADGSMLVHALLDLIVDNALEVVDEYHTKINLFEREILLKPKLTTVRHLHILSGDLILHKRTLEPIKTLIYGLRRYDLDRCAALIDTSDPANANVKAVGFMSHKSKIYLADVFDHMEYILTSLQMYADIAENLISYTFNLASYEMNEVMRRLTLATIIFLPLTLLTGYFGMNFEAMWSVKGHSDLLFWEIAIPVMVVIVPIFIVPDIRRLVHYIQKKMETKAAIKTFKRA